ncbi:MAG TPA: c-type cytochrome [Vicinamibacterales bacterium]|nr:c-type cytochrome [Vicinamibacterales bacterium]
MKKNKYLLLGSSLTVLVLLVGAAAQENFLQEWRQLQRSTTAADAVDVRLRQIVVPALDVTDRCVTCHVGMAPGEQSRPADRVMKAHAEVGHDPAAFGCTTCHGGQGRATEKLAAHGRVPFWPEPMIPLGNADAGCGSCHTHLRVPSLAQLRAGSAAFERNDCLACHSLDGRGGTLRPGGGGGMEGPSLSRAAITGYRPDWYDHHLAERDRAAAGPWRDSFAPIPAHERDALTALLESRVGAPSLIEGKALFHSLGCRGCHKVGGVGGDDGPDLTIFGQRDPGQLDFTHVPGERTVSNWIAEHFRAPAVIVPGSQMPTLGLTEPEITSLTAYLLSLRRSALPEAFWPRDRILAERFGEREFSTDGATLYGTFCAACHGPDGDGRRYAGMPAFPAIANPDFLSIASDEFVAETVRRGRPGRRMPAWGETEGGLRPEEITRVAQFVRTLGGNVAPVPDERPRRWAAGDAEAGERLYGSACATCHGPAGLGGEGPALNNRVLLASATDTYLVETVGRGRRGTSMEGFSRPSPTRPALAQQEIESIIAFIRTWEKKP